MNRRNIHLDNETDKIVKETYEREGFDSESATIRALIRRGDKLRAWKEHILVDIVKKVNLWEIKAKEIFGNE